MDVQQEIDNIKTELKEIRDRQLTYVGKHHDMDKELVAIQTELGYMREDVKAIQAGINRLIWTVGAAMIVAIVGFIIQGGLVS
jgi:predicted  nucleic acid-binding Zn-ribbon protein